MLTTLFFILLFFIQDLSATFTSGDPPPIEIPKIRGDIVLDGMPDEPAWMEINPLPLTTFQPVYGGPMTEHTEIRVAYDSEYIYISGRLYDSQADRIQANTMYRDRYSGDDTFAIILDTFNDKQNALWFFVTPTGVRVDQEVSRDAESINRDWTTFWDAATQITDEGWFVEVRIPFSSLGYQRDGDEVRMGMITYRYIARNNERHIFPDIPPQWTRAFAKPSRAQEIVLRDLESQTPLYITPYVLGGVDQQHQLNESGDAFSRITDYTHEAGLDIRYPVLGNLTLDMTVNTDFAQVEADDQQIDLSRFPLFFPEKRQFFQERAGIFEFSLGGPNRLFHSRRIGLDQGQQVRILGGGRLAGRVGSWDIGMLNMQTGSNPVIDLDSENFGVVRLRRDIINSNSYLGGMMTSRISMDGQYNLATGLDFLWNFTGNDYLDLKFAHTRDDRFDENTGLLDNSIFRINVERRTTEGIYHNTTLKRAGENYLPGVGFESRSDYTLFNTWVSYGRFLAAESALRMFTTRARVFISRRNFDGEYDSMRLMHDWDFDFKSGASLDAGVDWWYEDILEPLYFDDDTFVPAGDYSFYGMNVRYSLPSGRSLRSSVSAGWNTFYDGTQLSFELSPTLNLSRHVELSGDLELNYLDFPDRNQSTQLHLYRLRGMFALDVRLSLQVLTQYNTLTRQFSNNLRFRFNIREGNDFWIVYNENTNTQLDRTDPELPRFEDRVLLIKYTHSFY